MSTKPKVATKARLLESIEHLQTELTIAKDRAASNWSAKEKAERDLLDLENKLQIVNNRYDALQSVAADLGEKHAAEKARADAFELVLRLRYRAEEPSKSLVNGILGRP